LLDVFRLSGGTRLFEEIHGDKRQSKYGLRIAGFFNGGIVAVAGLTAVSWNKSPKTMTND
jgi:hypothetical protein